MFLRGTLDEVYMKEIIIEAETEINIVEMKSKNSCDTLKGEFIDGVNACVFVMVNPKDYDRYPKNIDRQVIANEAFKRYGHTWIKREETLRFFKDIQK